MLTSFDLLLIGIAIIIMLKGLARRRSLWRMGQAEDRPGDWTGLIGYLLGHKKILTNRYAGMAHLILLWGFVIPILIIILAQLGFNLSILSASLLSLLTDILGIMMLSGVMFFLMRRMKSTGLDTPKRTLLPLLILLFILLTGFLAEGARLSIVHPTFSLSSPVGRMFSAGLPASPIFMQVMIRLHFFAVLFFIAIVPFTFMRHLAASALNVCYIKKGPRGELGRVSLDKGPLGVKSVRDFTWKQLLDTEACVSCGRCEEKCPASISGKPLSPQKVIRNILEQMEEVNVFLKVDPNRIRSANLLPPLIEDSITGDEIWSCTTCMACVEHCPVFIEPVDKIIDIRRYQVMRRGLLPAEARPMIRNLEIYGDAQGKGAAHRGDWAFNRNVPLISTEGLDAKILLWVGCSGAFHPIYQETIRAMVKILKYGRVRFGILDREELCCGDPARRMGEEALFLELAQKNIDLFYKYNIQKIVTLCPHCYNTLKNEYPCLEDDLRSGHGKGPRSGSGIGFEVIHATEFVMDLIKEKKISPRYPISKTITIHDPCYLGRINHIYKPLRELIKAVPGLELKEMKENRENGFCCGGGGGRMWLHERLGRHMNQIRAEEVVETGVDLLGTACPYCMTMLDDGLKALEIDRPPKVSDIIEILAHSLE